MLKVLREVAIYNLKQKRRVGFLKVYRIYISYKSRLTVPLWGFLITIFVSRFNNSEFSNAVNRTFKGWKIQLNKVPRPPSNYSELIFLNGPRNIYFKGRVTGNVCMIGPPSIQNRFNIVADVKLYQLFHGSE
jgi:hypothetical protein